MSELTAIYAFLIELYIYIDRYIYLLFRRSWLAVSRHYTYSACAGKNLEAADARLRP